MHLSDFELLSFDCFGTLVDWEAGIWSHLGPLAGTSPRLLDRESVLEEFAEWEARFEDQNPWDRYPEILRRVYLHLGKAWQCKLSKITLDHDADRFAHSVGLWPLFPDTQAALAYLKNHFKLVILSNVDRVSFSRTHTNLGVVFDAVYTAEDIGSYKPDRRNFEYLIHHVAKDCGVEKSGILHTAQSLFHDHVPAKSCGLANAWIDRRFGLRSSGATKEVHFKPKIDFHYKNLAEMVTAHQAEIAAATVENPLQDS